MTSDPMSYPERIGEEAELEPQAEGEYRLSRRGFIQFLGAGILISVTPLRSDAQRRGGGGGGGGGTIAARVHIGKDGAITVMTGKVEGGQGARTEITQAAAEELRVPASRVTLIMGDTALVPDDGTTAGSMTTPRTLPPVRQGAGAAREVLIGLAAEKWSVPRGEVTLADGKALHAATKREIGYGELAGSDGPVKAFQIPVPGGVVVTPVKEFKVLGTPTPRANARDLVTGGHKFPSDMAREGMLHGKVLRAPSYGAKLVSVDLGPAKAMKDVVAVQDGSFVGVAAPTVFLAQQALDAIAKTAKWEPAEHPSSKELYDYLRGKARVPANPFATELAAAAKKLKGTYAIPYVQHSPLEPRAALAVWEDDKLTAWVGSQNPFGAHSELVRAFSLPNDRVRLIVPDFGGGFGGKHQPDAHIEAARLAKAAGKPVRLRWTREEEFTWAYFRPAAVIDIEAGLDEKGKLTSWHFVNINAGGAGVNTPYKAGQNRCESINSASPMRQGSYRCLATTGSNFARECFMDELAEAAGSDPLSFRLAHLDDARIRAVLEAAAQRFKFAELYKQKRPGIGVGIACGTEKGSVVAACAEVAVQGEEIVLKRFCEVFECGPILNPANLLAQVQGCIMMGLGPALREEMIFEKGVVQNAAYSRYLVPRLRDVPELDIQLLDRPDLAPAGAGETPIIVIAPAIANAVFHATGQRVRRLPIRLAKAVQA